LPVLRRNRFMTGDYNEEFGVKDVTWLAPDAVEMTAEHWSDPQTRCFGMLLEGKAQVSAIPRAGTDASVLLVFNAWHEAIDCTLPERKDGSTWTRMFDTALEHQEVHDFDPGDTYKATGRSVLGFVAAGAGQSADWLHELTVALPD
ncbi:MAG: glycogen debranching enzyme GlgX, partial [Burkholderiaceae bacterium]